MKVLVIGSINIDLVVTAEKIPAAGETLRGNTFETFQGGKGANQAVALAKAGAAVTLAGAVGSDGYGQQALQSFQQIGIDTTRCKVADHCPTGTALISIDASGDNSILVVAGANETVTPSQLQDINWSQFNAVVLQLEIPMPTIEWIVEEASAHCKIILTPAPAIPLSETLLQQVDVLIPNEHELSVVAGTDNLDEAIKKITPLLRQGLALTLGTKGVRWISAKEDFLIPAFSVEAKDTVGAGDCFSGYFVHALLSGKVVTDALRLACAASALKVQRDGAQEGMPVMKEVEAFLRKEDSQPRAHS